MMVKVNKRKGISLIALVITIIVMIILAATIILSLTEANIFGNAREGTFKSDVKAMQHELSVYIAEKVASTDGKYDSNLLYADKTSLRENGEEIEGKTIKDVITTVENKYLEEIVIEAGKLKYIGDETNKIQWSDELLNGVSGQKLKELPGTNLFTLQNCVNTNLVNYRIYGNSIQEGTPDADNAVEIQSVGEKTKNIADLSKAVVSSTTSHVRFNYDNLTGTIEYTSKPTQYDYVMVYLERDVGYKFEVGKTYYWKADITVSEKQTSDRTVVCFGVVWTDSGNSGRLFNVTENKTFTASGSFTYDGTQETIRLLMHANYGSVDPAKVKFENVYVSEVDEFVPHSYDLPITITGKNMFDINAFSNAMGTSLGEQQTENDIKFYSFATNNAYNKKMDFDGEENKQYTLSFKYKMTSGIYVFSTYYSDGTKLNHTVTTSAEWNDGTITTPADKTLIGIGGSGTQRTTDLCIGNIQLEEGSTATNYQPYKEQTYNIYLDDPLRKIGNAVDYIDFRNKKIVRNVEVIDNTGTLTLEQSLKALSDPKEETIDLSSISLNEGINYINIGTNIAPSNAQIVYYAK